MHELTQALDLIGGGFMPVTGSVTDLPTDSPPATHPLRPFSING